MFSETRSLTEDPLIVCAVHDCQVVALDLVGSDFDTHVDLIVTPTRNIVIPAEHGHKPGRVVWEHLEPGMVERIPPLQELKHLQKEHHE